MSKDCIFLLFLVIANVSNGQTRSFFADGARWVYSTNESGEPGQYFYHSNTEQNIIHGDTMIGGITYFKLYTTFHNRLDVVILPPLPPVPPIFSYDSIGPSFLRQDTTANKVYYLAQVDSTERLIYDFNLQVGDTTPMQAPDFPVSVVDSIDTIIVFGKQVKRFFLSIGETFQNFFIEGMGGTNGLTYLRPAIGTLSGGIFITHLNCFQLGDSIFLHGDIECPFIDFISATQKIDDEPVLTVSPNPTQDVFTITISEHLLNSTFTIVDEIGRLVHTFKLTEINSSARLTSSGIYFWRIEQSGRLIRTGKIVCE
jgi:hypothetical protein